MVVTTDRADPVRTVLQGHRPHLDGMRAVAVYLVLAFHASIGPLDGGFIGVDVFFVLSGFLVTHVIISSMSGARFSLREFYARRVRRLLPAAIVTVIATAALWSILVSPAELREFADGFRAALVYVSNWHFISQSTDYFATELSPSPVLHYWSLSIEEQFYLLWPLMLLGLLTLARRPKLGMPVVRVLVGVAVLASFAWALHLRGGNLNRAYYGTDTRAYQLLAGALLALSPVVIERARDSRWVRYATGPLLVMLIVAGTRAIDVGPITRGAIATVLTVGLLISIEAGDSWARSAMSIRPMTYLGGISYGTYLWHWPVILAADRVLDISATSLAILAAVVATGVAALSSELLEQPIRSSRELGRVPVPVIAAGIGLSVVGAFLVIPAITEPDARSVAEAPTDSSATPQEPDPTDPEGTASAPLTDAGLIDWQFASEDNATPTVCKNDIADCVLVEGDGPHVTLVGDSHAIMLAPAFEVAAQENNWTFSALTSNGCSWPRGIEYAHQVPSKTEECDRERDGWYSEALPALAPDLVLLILPGLDDPARIVRILDAEGTELRPPELGLRVAELAEATVSDLRQQGHKVVLIEPLPKSSDAENPLRCLSEAEYVEDCRFESTSQPTELTTGLQTIADNDPGVWTIDLDDAVCPALPTCDAVIDGTVVRWDTSHLTKSFALSLADEVAQRLIDSGALAD